jgi:hypothetical protein
MRSNIETLSQVNSLLDNMGFRPSLTHDNERIDKAVAAEFKRLLVPTPDATKLTRSVQTSITRILPAEKPPVNIRLTPSLGRTVAVDVGKGIDLSRALRLMESKCARNSVRQQEREQKFHVRRGQLKKDIRSRRWRKLFKVSFQKTIERCERLRRQGW